MANDRIKKVLIANRGEIAVRILRACKAKRIPCCVTVSDVDREAYFAKCFSELAPLEGKAARDTYLNIPKIIEAALQAGCNAVHPGYGFLSENSTFARAVREAGMIFIGPTPESMDLLGDKQAARRVVSAAGVPCVPGSKEAVLTNDQLVSEAERIGFPVIIKAAFGGGGRGMRVAQSSQELSEGLELARAEALKNFGDDTVFIERYLELPRHIEVQLFGDTQGNIIHFGTRECSLQRRHQKVVEEAPAPHLSPTVREQIHQAAIKAACSVRYQNAGTAEFLLAGEKFYFLEMNTRIQVEHPVTEQVFGVDLVGLQLDVANGKSLKRTTTSKKPKGHSIEFRVYAEEVLNDFRPALGRIENIVRPQAPYLREEYGFDVGDTITPYYDAMLSKIIVTGKNRKDAIEKSRIVMASYQIEGLATTIPLHRWVLNRPEFLSSEIDVRYLDRELDETKLSEIASLAYQDTGHKTLSKGREFREQRGYFSQAFRYEYQIEIVHRSDKTFLVVPIGGRKRAQEQYMRRSNKREVAVRNVIEEVLEKVSPEEVLR